MLEIEVKYPVKNWDDVERKLRDLDATIDEPREEADRYFNAPHRDFAHTDEALRLRRIGEKNFVTYKGPKTDAQTKTRTEIEVPLAPGDEAADDFAKLLGKLGYRAVAVVKKKRIVCHLKRASFDLEICLDNVTDVGKFVELEIMAPPASLDAAREVLLKLAGELGLEKQERRSYLEMLLHKRG